HKQSLPKFAELMRQSTERAVERLDAAARERQVVNIASEMMRLTLDIVTEALFSFDITERAAEIGEAMDTMTTIGKPRHRKVREAIELLDRIVYEIIEDRRLNPGEHRDDLLTMLLNARYDDGTAMPVKQIRDEVMALLVAGHETTANT